MVCLPAIFWYFFHIPKLAALNPSGHFFMGKSILEGASEISQNQPEFWKRFFLSPLHYSGLALMVLFIMKLNRFKTEFTMLLASMVILIPLILKTGRHFIHHDYYVLPMIPIFSICTGAAITSLSSEKIKKIILAVIIAEGIIHYYPDLRIPSDMKAISQLEQKLDSLKIKSPVAINGGLNPCAMYYTGRCGWSLSNAEFQTDEFNKVLLKGNCNAIIILKKTFEKDVPLNLKSIYSNNDYIIYKIK
jgi:hypothetical protein